MAVLELFTTLLSARWIIMAALSFALFKLWKNYIRVIHDAAEPTLVKQPFPVVGHLIGMLRDGSNYYTQISARTKLPIYSLALPGAKVYVVTSPHLATQVDKNPRGISFAPFMILFIKRIMVVSEKSIAALSENIEGIGHWGFREETLKMVHATTAHGDNLAKITQEMLKSLIPQLAVSDNEEVGAATGPRKEMLFAWMKRVVTRASTDAIYGADNPFHDPRVESGFWDLNADFALLGLNILPAWIAPRGNRGRETFFAAFNEYYGNKRHAEASPLAQNRYKIDREYDLSVDDTARFEISMCEGLLVNIVPAAFWCMLYVYQRPALLAEFRNGLDEYVEETVSTTASAVAGEKTKTKTRSVDFKRILSNYPLLSAVLKEVLRLLSTNASGRVLLKDTMLDGKYLLKKDAILLVPSAEVHSDPEIWGPDWAEFNPYRWLAEEEDAQKVPLSAYRAFGGGAWPCPGRQFSLNEIAAALVMVILQYDLIPCADGEKGGKAEAGGTKGGWKEVKTSFHINTSVLTPKEDIEVEVRPRKGTEGVGWRFCWGGEELL